MTVNNSQDTTTNDTENAPEAAKPPELPKNTKKLENARAKLPPLSDNAKLVFDSIVNDSLDLAELDTLAAHVSFYTRSKRTLAANDTKLTLNQVVRVVSGLPEIVGKVGTVVKLNRIRCYVEVDGEQHYLLTSDLVPVSSEKAEAVVDEQASNESVAQAQAAAV